jgi:hypothetical protein
MIIHPKAVSMPLAVATLWLAIFGALMTNAKAEIRWCSISDEGANNCSFVSVAQCLAAVSRSGGYCMPEAQMNDSELRASDSSTSEAKKPVNRRQHRNLPIDIHICRGC